MPIRVDIVSDVVCPWCVIGYRQLASAAEARQAPLEPYWHPFELNPGMAEEGENLREHLAAKYGTTAEDSRKARDRLTALGAALGFTFNYADDMRMWNTFRAHQLIDWAGDHGKGHDVKMALFAAFFTERRNVSDMDVLAEVAASVGLDRDAARTVLERGDRAAVVRRRNASGHRAASQAFPPWSSSASTLWSARRARRPMARYWTNSARRKRHEAGRARAPITTAIDRRRR